MFALRGPAELLLVLLAGSASAVLPATVERHVAGMGTALGMEVSCPSRRDALDVRDGEASKCEL